MVEQQTKAPAEVKQVAKFLRSRHAGMRIRTGALDGKRMACFKRLRSIAAYLFDLTLKSTILFSGKSAVRALLSPAYQKQKGTPKVESETDAIEVLQLFNTFSFYIHVQRKPSGISSSSIKALHVMPDQTFDLDEYYVWLYDGSQWTTYAGAVLLVLVGFTGVLFPLWPSFMHVFVGLIFIIALNRLVVYVITSIVAPPGIWIFPRLFADVGFMRDLSILNIYPSNDIPSIVGFFHLVIWKCAARRIMGFDTTRCCDETAANEIPRLDIDKGRSLDQSNRRSRRPSLWVAIIDTASGRRPLMLRKLLNITYWTQMLF
ncbi:translocation protein Sec62-domain-containing protein [Flagelloscypha sp. PMI_526]|nr:translocation protein Sec62-domain-containing protein [Flagelloscypha sp. PMI_526]